MGHWRRLYFQTFSGAQHFSSRFPSSPVLHIVICMWRGREWIGSVCECESENKQRILYSTHQQLSI